MHFFVTKQSRIKRGKKYLQIFLATVIEEEKAKVVQEQIEVVGGSRKVYELVDQNLRQNLIECSLWKETFDLYHWREKYFLKNLPPLRLWFSDIGEVDTISYQLTKNFQQVEDICCSRWKKFLNRRWFVWSTGKIYLGVSELDEEDARKRRRIRNLHRVIRQSANADACSWYVWLSLATTPWQHSCLRYGDLARILFEKYGESPSRLEELAMRKVKTDSRITLENLSRQVKMNDEYGFFRPETFQHDLPKFSEVGQLLLQRLKAVHEEITKKRKFEMTVEKEFN